MMIDGAELRRTVAEFLDAMRADPHKSAYGDGLVRGTEIALEEIDKEIKRARSRSGGTS